MSNGWAGIRPHRADRRSGLLVSSECLSVRLSVRSWTQPSHITPPPNPPPKKPTQQALAAYGYKEGMVLGFKDLGPQIGYRTGAFVFLVKG